MVCKKRSTLIVRSSIQRGVVHNDPFIPFIYALGSRLSVHCTHRRGLRRGGAGNPAATAIPTSTPIPTYGIALPTSMLVVSTSAPTAEATEAVEATAEATTEATAEATAAAVASSGGLDATLVERGKGRYEALDCASCHGSDGSGTDDGVSLIASTQTEAEYIAFMRSGGALGTAHQYPANRLSDTEPKRCTNIYCHYARTHE